MKTALKTNCLAAVTALTAFIKFVIPPDVDWNALNSELNDRLKPIHHNLSTDLISPDVAGDQIGYTIRDFLLSKPQFCEDKKSSGFVNHTPSSLRKVTSIKTPYTWLPPQASTHALLVVPCNWEEISTGFIQLCYYSPSGKTQ